MTTRINYLINRAFLFAFGLAALLFSISLSGCDDDPKPIDTDPHKITVTMNHVWGSSALHLEDWNTTSNNDSFQLTKLIYHINNFELIDADGNATPADEKWFMVNSEENMNPTFTMGDLDNKEFTAIRFTIGVEDSTVNADGMLNSLFTDPMYWGMANGYINFKLEGKSPSATSQGVVLHVGGYLFPNMAIAHVTVNFDSGKILSSQLGKNKLTLNADLSEYFHSPNTIDLAQINLIHMPGEDAIKISENWQTMFSFGGIN
ncbi:MAG: hypothetical protein GC181_02765 [Bacteroidetes bacterium]|nr:hypothetical protein [Bacteroidota bacterium]